MPSPLTVLGRVAAAAIIVAGMTGAGLAVSPAFADNSVNADAVADVYAMTQGGTLTVADPGLLANDTTTSGGELEVQSIQGAPAGLVLAAGNKGGFSFTPDPSFTGTATFSYVLVEINTWVTSDPTSVAITVQAASNGPVDEPLPCEVSQPCGDGTVPPCDPDALPTTPEDAPDCIPVIPPCDPNALPTTPEDAPDCIPVIPPCDPNALPTTPEDAPDCIPGGTDPGIDPGPDLPCAVGSPGCDPAEDDPVDDIPTPVLDTLATGDEPAGLAQTGTESPAPLGGAALMLLAGGAGMLALRTRRPVTR